MHITVEQPYRLLYSHIHKWVGVKKIWNNTGAVTNWLQRQQCLVCMNYITMKALSGLIYCIQCDRLLLYHTQLFGDYSE